MILIRQYVSPEGTSPFGEWFDGLDDPAAARVHTTMSRLGQGNFSSVKGVGGGTKKRQARDIADAHRCWQDYKRRK